MIAARLAEAREVGSFAVELVQAYVRTTSSRAEIRTLQEARLKNVLRAASQTRLYKGASLHSLESITPLRKTQIIERVEDSVIDPALTRRALLDFVNGGGAPGAALLGKYLAATTSGTTGHVAVFVDALEGWARQRAIVFARIFQGMLKPEGFALLLKRRYRLAFVVATGGHWLTSVLASRMPKMGRAFANSDVFPIDKPLPSIVDDLNRFAPLLLHTYPTFLEVLAHEKIRGRLTIEPEILSVGSETVSESCRAAVRAAFPSSRFVETYAATECLAMATSCPHGALHVNEDACILEPVDDDLRAVPLGVAAPRVLVTNLLNTVQPLLRYELTDSLTVFDAPCPCGSAFRTVKVTGRTDDAFFLVDGQGRAQEHPPIPFEIAFLGVRGLLQYQLVHEEQNRLRLHFVVDDPPAAPAVARVLDERLARHLNEHGLLDEVSYVVEQVDALERHARSKKLRQITSRVGRPALPVVPASAARRPAT